MLRLCLILTLLWSIPKRTIQLLLLLSRTKQKKQANKMKRLHFGAFFASLIKMFCLEVLQPAYVHGIKFTKLCSNFPYIRKNTASDCCLNKLCNCFHTFTHLSWPDFFRSISIACVCWKNCFKGRNITKNKKYYQFMLILSQKLYKIYSIA